jgi:two-component system CheB/CheR fusion protein
MCPDAADFCTSGRALRMKATLLEYLDHAPVFLRRPNGEILHWTDGCRELYGFAPEEAQGRISHDLLQTVFPEDLGAIEARLQDEGEWSGRLRHTTKDGRSLWTLSVWRLREGKKPAGPLVIEQITDITSHVQLEEQRMLLARELEHRVKNLLAVVQSLARTSFPDAPAEQKSRFDNRLLALAQANQLLREASWDEAGLRDVAREVARALGLDGRLQLSGPDVTISSQHVMGFALAIHELCTNALKHGALSVPQGIVDVTCEVDTDHPDHVRVLWRERGGPSPVEPAKPGFGTRLIQQAVAGWIGAPAQLRFEPEGVACELRLAISTVQR